MAANTTRFHIARTILATCCVLGAALGAATARAEAPARQDGQVAGYYRMMVGDLETTALYDGYIGLKPELLKGASASDIQSLLAQMFVPRVDKGVQTAVNGFLINTGKHLILVDAGAAQCFGPTLGGMQHQLRAAGYEPVQVDSILLTHLHGDHVCGITTADGKAAFPNATVYVAKEESGFWLDSKAAARAAPSAQPSFKLAQDAVAPYAASGRLKEFKAGATVLPGVVSVPLHGHTPGHGGYLFSSGQQQLLIWGDVIHSHAVQFTRPDVAIEFDTDAQQAIASREQILERASREGLWIAGAHLPFPGLGHVRQDGRGYRWIPVEYAPLPVR